MFDNLKNIRRWWLTWKTLPVGSWIKAAKLYKSGLYAEAIKYYEKGLKKHKLHPARFCAHMDLAYCLFREKRFQDAEQHLKKVITFMPKSREAHLRLARLQLWTGRSLDAAWTMRRALRFIESDEEALGLFMFAVIDNGGPSFLMNEVIRASVKQSKEKPNSPNYQAIRGRLAMMKGDTERGRQLLEEAAQSKEATLQVLLLYIELLIEEGKLTPARQFLRKALSLAPEHPRVLSLLAVSYLKSGPYYNSDFAQQLATKACQNTNWLSPREMHVLAEVFYHQSDKISALIIASKAKEEGSRLLGNYRDAANLERLIEDLSTGTQA